MKDFEKLHYETMPFEELEKRLKRMSEKFHKRDLDIVCDIYIRRIELDKEFKKAIKSTMKSL